MMSDFRAMNQKIRTLEGKNRTLGGDGGSKIVGHHIWMIPYLEPSELLAHLESH